MQKQIPKVHQKEKKKIETISGTCKEEQEEKNSPRRRPGLFYTYHEDHALLAHSWRAQSREAEESPEMCTHFSREIQKHETSYYIKISEERMNH